MKRLLNTLYVTSGNKYLSLEGENIVVLEDQKEIGRVPLHNLRRLITFVIQEQVRHLWSLRSENIDLLLMSGNGRFSGSSYR